MNKALLRSYMVRYGDTQKSLSIALGISLSGLNAKINSVRGTEFRQSEIAFIRERYSLSAAEVDKIFFAHKLS